MTIWNLLSIIAIIGIVVFWNRDRKPIFGSLVIGIIAAAIAVLIAIISSSFNWKLIQKTLTICILMGVFFALLNLYADRKLKANRRKKTR